MTVKYNLSFDDKRINYFKVKTLNLGSVRNLQFSNAWFYFVLRCHDLWLIIN